jgi:hypothetical protein
LVESFCIHARVINDFLGNWGQGVHAKKVTDDYRPFRRGKIDKRIIKKINEQIAHLGKYRTVDPKKLVNQKRRTRMIKVLAEELVTVQRHWKRRYTPTWHVVPYDHGYELRRPRLPAITLSVK